MRPPTYKPHKTRKHVENATTRTVKATDASPDYIVSNLTANTKAIRSRQFFKQLGHREAGMTKKQISEQDARMRQALILLTGGCGDADLFVQPSTGRLKSTPQINVAIQDLMGSYRMQHSRTGAFVKRVLRKMEQISQKGASLYHFGVVFVALVSVLGTQHAMNKALTKLSQLFKHKLSSNRAKSALLTLALFAYPTLTQNKQADVFRIVVTNATDGITKWRSAQLVEAVLTDGLSPDDIANMKKVAREMIALDNGVEALKVNGEIPTPRLQDKITQFEKSTRSVMRMLSFGSWLSNKERMVEMFRYALKRPKAYTRTTFVREMIAVCGSAHIRGYHFLNGYGDRRSSVKDIMAAYLIVHERSMQSLKQFKEKWMPTVAKKSSVKSAKFRQQFTRTSKTAKNTSATKIQNVIRKHTVVIFSKTYCPYCKRVKELFKKPMQKGQCKVVELDTLRNGVELQTTLQKMTKQSTVPNVFLRGQHIGGCDAVEERLRKLGYLVEEGE